MSTPEPEYRSFRTIKLRPPDRMDMFKSWLCVVIGGIYVVIFFALLVGGLLVYSSSSARASKLTPVIPECVELAQREGFPTDFLTRLQLARAKIRMARLSDRDPLVKTCREAAKAARAANPTGGPP